jgi:hypothetical protein
VEDAPKPPDEPAPLNLVDVNTTAYMAGIRPATVHQHLAKGTIPTPEIRISNAYAWRCQTIGHSCEPSAVPVNGPYKSSV